MSQGEKVVFEEYDFEACRRVCELSLSRTSICVERDRIVEDIDVLVA